MRANARITAFVVLAALACRAGAAEPLVLVQPEFQPAPTGGGSIVEADRRIVTQLEDSRRLLAAGEYAKAVPLLQAVLDVGRDGFFRPEGEPESTYRSTRAEATRLIGSIPADERPATYELEFGPVAKARLDEAIRTADAAALADVARRHLHTEAGHEAQYRLGSWHLDRGRLLAAGLCLDRLAAIPEAAERFEPTLSLRRHAILVATGESERAAEVARSLVERFAGRTLELGGAKFDVGAGDERLFAELRSRFDDPLRDRASADDWTTTRGGPTRSGLVAFAPQATPNPPRWSASTVVDPFRDDPTSPSPTEFTKQLDAKIDTAWQTLVAAGRIPLPSTQPIVVGERIVARTLADTRVHDLATGNTLVFTLHERALEELVGFEQTRATNPQLLSNYVTQRVWGDGNQGTFSADGRRLYVVEDAGPAVVQSIDLNTGVLRAPSKASRLVAYDLESGKIAWQAGGAIGDFPSPLAGWFFLGAPLPISGGLFAIAEVDNEVRLVQLESTSIRGRETIEAVWSQPLAAPHLDLGEDVLRRTTGLVPTYADGVLVCPTGTGIFVAVDASDRSLLWARRFEVGAAADPSAGPDTSGVGWKDELVIASGGRLVLVPRTAHVVRCVDLRTGADLWKEPADGDDGLYVAGVADEMVVLVGAKRVRAISLADGKPAWTPGVPVGPPAGRGFLVPGRAVLPLASNHVAVVDLAAGKVLAKIAAPEGVELGNLVPAGDVVVSQSEKSVDVFPLELPPVERTVEQGD